MADDPKTQTEDEQDAGQEPVGDEVGEDQAAEDAEDLAWGRDMRKRSGGRTPDQLLSEAQYGIEVRTREENEAFEQRAKEKNEASESAPALGDDDVMTKSEVNKMFAERDKVSSVAMAHERNANRLGLDQGAAMFAKGGVEALLKEPGYNNLSVDQAYSIYEQKMNLTKGDGAATDKKIQRAKSSAGSPPSVGAGKPAGVAKTEGPPPPGDKYWDDDNPQRESDLREQLKGVTIG